MEFDLYYSLSGAIFPRAPEKIQSVADSREKNMLKSMQKTLQIYQVHQP